MQQKVDFIWQPVMTSSVAGQRKSLVALSKIKLAPKKSHHHCLVVCCPSDPIQLSESRKNHYIWKLCSANQWDAPKTAMPAQHWSTEKTQFISTTVPNHLSHNQQFKSWTNWTTKICLIHYIHLTVHQPSTTSSSVSTTFCRENVSTASRVQKMLSKSSLNPKAWIFTLQE